MHASETAFLLYRAPTYAGASGAGRWDSQHLIRDGTEPRAGLRFDRWAGDAERRVSFAISASDQSHIEQFAEILEAELGKPSVLTDSDIRKGAGGVKTLLHPLANRPLDRPFAELYRHRSFLTQYAPFTSIRSAKDVSALRDVAVSCFRPTVLAVFALGGHHEVFPNIKVREKVREHLVRDRSAAAARAAKKRDAYTCRVCGFDYGHFYGALGDGYADAHHVQPLASLKVGTQIRAADLVTVCANCHRMLHKMGGEGKRDLARLKSIVESKRKRRR